MYITREREEDTKCRSVVLISVTFGIMGARAMCELLFPARPSHRNARHGNGNDNLTKSRKFSLISPHLLRPNVCRSCNKCMYPGCGSRAPARTPTVGSHTHTCSCLSFYRNAAHVTTTNCRMVPTSDALAQYDMPACL